MTAVYAIATVLGLVGIVGWVLARGSTDGSSPRFDPEARFGPAGRAIVAATTGFGLAGMSSTFAGWSPGVAVIAAIVGAIAMGGVSNVLGPVADEQ